LDLEIFKIKPWRAPGADISDYFNFGFDEFTWNAYCHKQDKLRGEFNPQKIMAEIMKGPGGPLPGTEVGKNKNSPLPGGNNGLPQPPMGMFPPGMPPPPGMFPPGFQMPSGMQMPPGAQMPPGFQMPPNFQIPPGMKVPNMSNFNFNMSASSPPPPPPPTK